MKQPVREDVMKSERSSARQFPKTLPLHQSSQALVSITYRRLPHQISVLLMIGKGWDGQLLPSSSLSSGHSICRNSLSIPQMICLSLRILYFSFFIFCILISFPFFYQIIGQVQKSFHVMTSLFSVSVDERFGSHNKTLSTFPSLFHSTPF